MQRDKETDTAMNGQSYSVSTFANIEEGPLDRSSLGYPVTNPYYATEASLNSVASWSVLENQRVFHERLREFHESVGLSIIASFAREVLDLFVLYTEVTSKGGFEQVTRDGRWSEIAYALDFTNRSYGPSILLKELYGNLLYQFELIYFWGQQENLLVSPVQSISPPSTRNRTSLDHQSNHRDCATTNKTNQNNSCESSKASSDPGAQVGNTVIGEVETEFDCGYLINVRVGAENLNGVLYKLEDSSAKQFAAIPSLMDGVCLEDSNSQPVGLQIRVDSSKQEEAKLALLLNNESQIKPNVGSTPKKKNVKEQETNKDVKKKPKAKNKVMKKEHEMKNDVKKEQKTKNKDVNKDQKARGPNMGSKPKKEVKDHEAPQRPRSAYQYFLCKECDRLKKMHKNARNVRQLVINAWKSLSESDRQPYLEESCKDRLRFEQEMSVYKERRNMQAHNMKNTFPKAEACFLNFQDGYHVKLQVKETAKLFVPCAPMDAFTTELMENARKLDASMQIDLGDDLFDASM